MGTRTRTWLEETTPDRSGAKIGFTAPIGTRAKVEPVEDEDDVIEDPAADPEPVEQPAAVEPDAPAIDLGEAARKLTDAKKQLCESKKALGKITETVNGAVADHQTQEAALEACIDRHADALAADRMGEKSNLTDESAAIQGRVENSKRLVASLMKRKAAAAGAVMHGEQVLHDAEADVARAAARGAQGRIAQLQQDLAAAEGEATLQTATANAAREEAARLAKELSTPVGHIHGAPAEIESQAVNGLALNRLQLADHLKRLSNFTWNDHKGRRLAVQIRARTLNVFYSRKTGAILDCEICTAELLTGEPAPGWIDESFNMRGYITRVEQRIKELSAMEVGAHA